MRSDGQATKDRILVAARAEFAAHGLAGARVDRIAASANASKERLYAYFGDKRALFAAVLEVNLRDVTTAVPLDATDLPGFVGKTYDHATGHPEHLRMLDWARLENQHPRDPRSQKPWRGDDEIAAIREAQRVGTVDPSWDPEELLTTLLALATAWTSAPAAFDYGINPPTAAVSARRRETAVNAARKLLG